jgi:cystine transport system substrate-binding protein
VRPDRFPKEKSVRRKFLAAAVALLAAVSIASCSSGSDSSTLMVGTEGTYSPFSFQGSDGKLTGYDIEVVQAVGAKLGKNVEFVQTPFDSIFAGLEAKRFDLIANQVTINDARKAKYDL